MEDTMYVLYTCDVYHTQDSKRLLALSENFRGVIQLATEQVTKDGGKITDDDLDNLRNISQTQNLENVGYELILEEHPINTLLGYGN